ncbi:LPS-assembly protein [Orbus hercynius]|uniref:LPS-assembly protein LptD n=1 Tax=Orbus hercynius TaxID=593135 RepID=A0A495RHV9_9GAMM|nr:LPS assembly protein LptD [Orbus hercynius]RKS87113.1 LPS-assembly protein [Orbus hercynius]
MKKLTPSFIAAAVCLSVHSQDSFANMELVPPASTNNQCLIDVPIYNRPLVEGDVNTLPIEVSSDKFEIDLPNQAIYSGNVLATQGNRMVNSEQIIINQTANTNRNLVLSGNVVYQDNLIEMQGNKAEMNLNTDDIEIQNGQYHLVGRLGRGTADNMTFNDNRYIVLNNGSFTSCPINDSSWNIEGSKIIYDNREQLLEVWNAVFKIGKVPVLYSPYLQLPTGNKRRSGLLMPEISYDSIDGIDVSLPFYWNIAPNYDATFTPRIIQRRGVQLQTEMRYLNYVGLGTIAFDWLQHDRLYSNDRKDSNNSGYSENDYRWLFHWKNNQLINDNWRFNVDATRVSDNQYITDLSSKYASETDGYLTQHYQLGYTDQYWDIGLNYKYFQALRDDIKDDLYRAEPQLNINYYNNDNDGINFRTFGQVSHFVSSGSANPTAWRFHVEPTLDYTILSSWASVTAEAGFMATHYNQDIPRVNKNADLESSVNRFMPKIGIDGKVIFERQAVLLDGYTQTLEPRIKYLYIPYRNQSQIRNYDSSLLQSDYIGLFRDQPYSGLDRIASSNKVATGVTTRFYDANKIEKFNLSLGQIYYFTKSRTGDTSSPLDQNDGTGSVTWATDTFWRINQDIITRSGIQYDTRINEISLANAIIEYRKTDNKLVQLSYRYANKNYINGINLTNNTTPYQQSISQIGVISSWPLTETVSVVGSLFYDIDNKQSSNSYVGLHYADCCWGVTLQYGRKITDWDNISKESIYENKFSINFELRGLTKNSNMTAKMLDFGLLPYKTAFEEDY